MSPWIEIVMKPLLAVLACAALLGACRDYRYDEHIAAQGGLLPADQFARYGREQAISVAIGRELARPYNSGPEAQAAIATAYARKFPDVLDVVADPPGYRLTVRFRSGWRTAVVPIADGKRGDATKIPS